MSWNILKKSFNESNSCRMKIYSHRKTKRRHKHLEHYTLNVEESRIEDDDNDEENKSTTFNTSFCKYPKKMKLDLREISSMNIPDEGAIKYDPDNDDICNGCKDYSVKSIALDVYNERRTPFGSMQAGINRSGQSTIRKSINFHNSFQHVHKEVDELEKSIFELNSSDDEAVTIRNTTNLADETFIEESNDSTELSMKSVKIEEENENNTHRDQCNRENEDLHFFVKEIEKDLRLKSKIRCIKGGHVEHFRRTLQKFHSDKAFYEHERRSGIIPKGLVGCISNITESYGVKIARVQVERRNIFICLNTVKSDNITIKPGSKIELDLSSSCYSINGKIVDVAPKIILL